MPKVKKQNDKSDKEMEAEVGSMLSTIAAVPEVNTPDESTEDKVLVDSLSTPEEVAPPLTEVVDQQPRAPVPAEKHVKYEGVEEEEAEVDLAPKEKEPEPEKVEAKEEKEKEGEIFEYVDEEGNPVHEDGSPITPEETEKATDEVQALREQVAALQSTINLTAQTGFQTPSEAQEAEAAPTETATTPEPVQAPAAPVSPQIVPSPLTPEVMDSILEGNGDALAGYVAQVAQIARQDTLREVPIIIQNILKTDRLVDNFFATPENRDLLPMIDYTKSVAMELEQKHPTLTIPELLQKAAEDVRVRVGMTKNEEVVEEVAGGPTIVKRRVKRKVPTSKNGGTAPGTRARRKVVVPKKDENSLDAQLESMFNA